MGVARKMKCYNSGQIGKIGYLTALANFRKADKEIIGMGMLPVNPLNNGLKPSRPWVMHMAVDILMLASCGNAYFQKNWKESRGARIEYKVAKFLGITIWFEENEGCE